MLLPYFLGSYLCDTVYVICFSDERVFDSTSATPALQRRRRVRYRWTTGPWSVWDCWSYCGQEIRKENGKEKGKEKLSEISIFMWWQCLICYQQIPASSASVHFYMWKINFRLCWGSLWLLNMKFCVTWVKLVSTSPSFSALFCMESLFIPSWNMLVSVDCPEKSQWSFGLYLK